MALNEFLLSRNLGLLSKDQYSTIASKKILIAGCGIGSIIAVSAARTGFHLFKLADGDHVEETNLNRQDYSVDDIGKPKVEALAQSIRGINPQSKVDTLNSYLSESNIVPTLEGVDLVVDAIDPLESPNAVIFLHRTCREKEIPVVYPIDIGWGGGIFVFLPDSKSLDQILEIPQGAHLSEEELRDKFISYYTAIVPEYFNEVLSDVMSGTLENIPQPASATYVAAALSVVALKRLALKLPVKTAPQFINFDPHSLHLGE
jgi:molybdopterin/thiamine biosynthesis adenylyltransferase